MRDSSDMAREVADVTLLSNDLRDIAVLRRLSMRVMRRIRNNFRFIVGFNTALLALGIGGILTANTSAVLHNASTMAISAATMRPLLHGGYGDGEIRMV